MNPDTPTFPSSFVGGRTRPRRLSADPFSSPTSAVPMAPLRQRCSYFLDDGPRSEIQEESLINIQKKFAIPPAVVMRCPSEFERAPDGGSDEIAIYEAYLEAGFRVGVPSIVAKVSLFFGFCPSQLTPLTWRTLMAIQVLGEFHGFVVGVHEILYSYYFAPLVSKPGFYHLRSRDGTPLVEEPSRGIKDVAHPVSFIGEVVVKLVLGVPQRFQWVNFLMSKEALRHSRVWVRGMAFHRDQSDLRVRATKKVDHWNLEEEYRCYLFWAEGVDQLMTGAPVQAATSGSAAGSRYSADPFF
ncbi:hypothetical protein Bca52824_039421 [Brassica carinata]|uniref:Uncharacterized protein n=1 Tax=Brassica carinata TaxID=52824 RepID=A0A8X7RRD1_BRACI|nr:hypothetical protein Bca52824_039421 [Brassica carinata]